MLFTIEFQIDPFRKNCKRELARKAWHTDKERPLVAPCHEILMQEFPEHFAYRFLKISGNTAKLHGLGDFPQIAAYSGGEFKKIEAGNYYLQVGNMRAVIVSLRAVTIDTQITIL